MNRRAILIAGEVVLLAAAVAAAVLATEPTTGGRSTCSPRCSCSRSAGQFLSVRTGSVRIGPGVHLHGARHGPARPRARGVDRRRRGARLVAEVAARRWELGFNNIVALTTYPVVGALLFDALGSRRAAARSSPQSRSRRPSSPSTCSRTSSTSSSSSATCACATARACASAFVRLYLPVVPWEVATGALTAGTVLAYQEVGLVAIAMLAVMLVTSRYLLQAVVDAQRQRDELRAQMEELEALHHGVVRVMVETLGMRDRMTARHSAAVARFAKATAAAAGLPPREQELVHTAGLLHDVGKFTFPDHTLTSRHLTPEDWELIRSHPQRGADIVGRVHGYGEVADIILCHHERMDGAGYPRNLAGERHPAARAHPVRRRLLRRDDRARLLPHADRPRGRGRGAAPRLRHPARRASRRGLHRRRDGDGRRLLPPRRRGPRGGAAAARAAVPGARGHAPARSRLDASAAATAARVGMPARAPAASVESAAARTANATASSSAVPRASSAASAPFEAVAGAGGVDRVDGRRGDAQRLPASRRGARRRRRA